MTAMEKRGRRVPADRPMPSSMSWWDLLRVSEPLRFDRDVVRGLLIFIVILDHNDIIRNVRAVQDWFLPMTFHVTGFLLLPFLTKPKRFEFTSLRDHFIRYLVPFCFAVFGYAMIYRLVLGSNTPGSTWLADLLGGLVFADPWRLKVATGFIVLWFLPALLEVFLLTTVFAAVAKRWRVAILTFAIAVHLGVGGLPVPIKAMVPQGMLIAFMIFPLGLFARIVLPWLSVQPRLPCMVTAIIVLLACWKFEHGVEVEVATLVLPTLQRPLWIVATDLSDLSFLVLTIAATPVLARIPGLALLGRYSLLVYLFHPLLYKPIISMMLRICRLDVLGTTQGDLIYWSGAVFTVFSRLHAIGGRSHSGYRMSAAA